MPQTQQAGLEPYVPEMPIPHIHEMEITLFRTVDPDHPEGPQSLRFRFSVFDQHNRPLDHRHGDAVPILQETPALRHWIADLVQFGDEIWALAEEGVIPQP
jgi:hypothetical protein